jgi:hypothetical protein
MLHWNAAVQHMSQQPADNTQSAKAVLRLQGIRHAPEGSGHQHGGRYLRYAFARTSISSSCSCSARTPAVEARRSVTPGLKVMHATSKRSADATCATRGTSTDMRRRSPTSPMTKEPVAAARAASVPVLR